MKDLAMWMAMAGSFYLSTRSPNRKKAKELHPSSSEEWSLLLALCTTMVEVLTVAVILMLLMLAGDVETNPGPGSGEEKCIVCRCVLFVGSSNSIMGQTKCD